MPSLPPASSVLQRLPAGSRIAVIRLRSLGDCVLTTPALALLTAHRPDLRVAVVVEDRFQAVFEGNPGVERILSPQAGALLNWRPRMVLNLHGGTRSMALTMASGALPPEGIRAGFAHHRYSFLYSDKIPRAQEILGQERPVHTAEHIASAMFWMGVPKYPIPRAQLFLTAPPAASASANYAVLHPFASEAAKTWPVERFLEVAAHLQHACGLEPLFVSGPGDDAGPFERFRVWRGAPLSEVKSLLAGAQIFIGNDSGPAHIAAAFGVPVVAIFGASDPVTWAPWRTEARVLRSTQGIEGVETAEAIAAIEALRGVRARRA